MAREWTQAQKTAITADVKNLLVSAAAGSGKTAVLTERIVKKLLDEDTPLSLSELLVVTFTKAAASELKDRIASALSNAIAQNPENRHLTTELLLLPQAQISTIHSFCLELIKCRFQKLGLGAGLRVAEESEAQVLAEHCMNDVLDAYYEGAYTDIADFPSFVDLFVQDRDQDFATQLVKWYRILQNEPEGYTQLIHHAEELETCETGSFWESRYGKVLLSSLCESLQWYGNIFEKAEQMIAGDSDLVGYTDGFSEVFRYTQHLNFLLQQTKIDEARNYLSGITFSKLGRAKADAGKQPGIQYQKKMRDDFKKFISKQKEGFLQFTQPQIQMFATQNAQMIRNLYALYTHFDAVFSEEKRRRSLLDFSDLEHYALQVLYEPDGTISEMAYQLSARYKEIYIDEYQDVNSVQDRIFSAIAQGSKRFMVGDIKQSIYGFRGANPALFSAYRQQYPICDIEKPLSENMTVFLSENFRSQESVLACTNAVFNALFPVAGKTVPYEKQDHLVCGKRNDCLDFPVQVILLESAKRQHADENEEMSEAVSEAEFVAEQIQNMLNEENRVPSDFAILLRSVRTKRELFERALQKRAIPIAKSDRSHFFEEPEISLIISLLTVIDSPFQDIPLVAVLQSPLFGITLDELALIRQNSKKGTFYDALLAFSEETDFTKGKYFLNQLSQYRAYAATESVDRLIWYLYQQTGFFALLGHQYAGKAMQEAARKRLKRFYHLAKDFESRTYHGLYPFLSYLKEQMERKSADIADSGKEGVQIMSVHHSKGLQFPVCFFCGLGSRINTDDLRRRVYICNDFGILPQWKDESGFGRIDTPFRLAGAVTIDRAMREEELRVLYVALTRAQEKLILTASVASPSVLLERAKEAMQYCTPGFLRMYDTPIEWILPPLCEKNSPYWKISAFTQGELRIKDTSPQEMKIDPDLPNSTSVSIDSTADSKWISEFEQRFSYSYPYAVSASIPAKLAVSKLHPQVLDPFLPTEDAQEYPAQSPIYRVKTPGFLMPESADHASAAERGTATHIVMQFCDFTRVVQFGVDAEMDRLVKEAYIPKREAELVDRKLLANFFASDLFASMQRAKKLYRELRFNIRLPASEFTQNKTYQMTLSTEEVLVQGVIDCLYETEDGKWVLVDYKTDAVLAQFQNHPEDMERLLRQRHEKQLAYYRRACQALLHVEVSHSILYAFALGKAIEL